MSKTIRVRAKIEGFSETHCLLYDVENTANSNRFRRFHLWIPLEAVKTLKIGSIIEFTGNVYHYGRNKIGLHKIRKVVEIERVNHVD